MHVFLGFKQFIWILFQNGNKGTSESAESDYFDFYDDKNYIYVDGDEIDKINFNLRGNFMIMKLK